MTFNYTNQEVWVVMWIRHGEPMLNGVYLTKRDAYCALLWILKEEEKSQKWDKATRDEHFSHLIERYKNSKVVFGNLDIAYAEKTTIMTVEE